MLSEVEKNQAKQWIDALVGKDLDYISRSKIAVIKSVDWDDSGRLNVSRDESSITIRWERIESVISRLKNGNPIHVDTVLRSSGNDRTIIETIVASFPTVGYMKPNQGRNKSRNKVLQWMNEEVHPLGEILDVSDEIYISSLVSNKQNTTIISEKVIGQFVFKLTEFLVKNNLEPPLFQYLIEKIQDSKSYNIEFKHYRLTSIFKISDQPISEDELKRGDKLRFFANPFKIGSHLYYLSNQWTDGTDSRLDIQTLITIFNALYDDYKIAKEDDSYVLTKSNNRVNETNLSKPFLLLAGISGTGKTRFVREQAKATGSLSDTYCLTSVRPDWHEPSDILGYISRLSVSGDAEYVTTEVLQFIAKAWRAIIDAGLELTVNDINDGARLVVTGEKGLLDEVLPYWLCLDEMNLAPVEQYFADYLSVLETREWQWQGDDFDYCCDPLLKSATIQQLVGEAKTKLRSDLGFGESEYDREWDLFCEHGLSIPFNLIVAGTVNMDETTHGFSRKVIDRALSFDFGEFFPNDFDHFFTPTVRPNTLSYPIHAQAAVEFLPALDSSGERSIGFLKSVNAVLDNTPFQLAFRALNELLLAVISTQPETDHQLQAVWDDFLMCKVLPRIEGDHDKLTVNNSATTNSNAQSLLDELSLVLKIELTDIWDEPKDSVNARPDLYREKIAEADDQRILRIACRSKAKLAWMQARLQRSGFTSFWP